MPIKSPSMGVSISIRSIPQKVGGVVQLQLRGLFMLNTFNQALTDRRREASIRFSRTDKSDPFTFNRAMSHIHSGVVGFRQDKINGKSVVTHCLYDADTFPSTHDIDPRWEPLRKLQAAKGWRVTSTVNGTAYRNVCRP